MSRCCEYALNFVNTEEMKNRKPWSFCETPEEKCTMNYCDENGCQNRKRNYVQDNDLIADVMRCFDMKKDELKDSINYDIKYFGGGNVSKLIERLNSIEDLRDLVSRVVFK